MTLHLFIGLGCPPPQHTACDVGQRLPPPRRRIPAVAPNSAGIAASLVIAEPAGETMDKLPTSTNLFAAPAASVYSLRDETAPVPTIAPQPSSLLVSANPPPMSPPPPPPTNFCSSRARRRPRRSGPSAKPQSSRALSDATAGNGADHNSALITATGGRVNICFL